MTTVRFRHNLESVEKGFLDTISAFKRAAPRAVRATAREGWRDARRISRRRSGPHGKNLYKRITTERTGPLEHEYGYEGEKFVGGGFRNGAGNLDIAQSSDGLADKLEKRLTAVTKETWRL